MKARKFIGLVVLLCGIFGAIAMMAGCQTFQGKGPLPQGISLLTIDAAKLGITAGLSPRVETAYAQGKINFTVYTTLRAEEDAALKALSSLRNKRLAGEDVTQAELDDAVVTFVNPLQILVDKYVPVSLPATQPAK